MDLKVILKDSDFLSMLANIQNMTIDVFEDVDEGVFVKENVVRNEVKTLGGCIFIGETCVNRCVLLVQVFRAEGGGISPIKSAACCEEGDRCGAYDASRHGICTYGRDREGAVE